MKKILLMFLFATVLVPCRGDAEDWNATKVSKAIYYNCQGWGVEGGGQSVCKAVAGAAAGDAKYTAYTKCGALCEQMNTTAANIKYCKDYCANFWFTP